MDESTASGGEGQAAAGASEPPSSAERRGISAFMFTDVRGYTDYTSTHGAEAASALVSTFTSAVADIVEVHRGEVRGTWGDEVFVVFESPRDAVRAGAAIVDFCMAASVADRDVPLFVGVGLDAGEAIAAGEAVSGSGVNVAARLCSRAAAGEVLMTRSLAHLCGAIPGVTFEDHGRAKLKGVPGRTQLVRARSTSRDKVQEAAFRTLLNERPARRRQLRRRRTWVAALVTAALLVGAGTWSLASLRSIGVPVISGGSVGVIDASSGRLEATVALPPGYRADAVVVGKTASWLLDSQAGVVFHVDKRTRRVVQRIAVGDTPVAAAEYDGFLWVVNEGDGTVSQISEAVDEQVGTIAVGKQPDAIAIGLGYLWVADRADNQVTRVDPTQRNPSRNANVGDAPAGLVVAGGQVWVTNSTDNTVSTIDPTTMTASAPILVGAGPKAIIATSSGIFVANNLEQNVSRIDPVTRGETARISVGDAPAGLAAVGNSVWVSDSAGATLTKIDGTDSRAAKTLAVGSSPGAVASDGSRLWVATKAFASAVHRGGTLTYARSDDAFDTLDPAQTYSGASWNALGMVYDGLVTLRKAAGPEATELVPDLAIRLPRPAPDGSGGQLWEFTLRTGIRYSDGRTVRPEDVRRGLERLFTADPGPNYGGYPQYYIGIKGAEACLAHPSTCDLSEGVTVDDTTNSVTIHLTAPDPDFLYKLALIWATVVPPGTPMTGDGYRPYAGTGPYLIKDYLIPADSGTADGTSGHVTKERLTLVRNPYFHQWSSAAQPAGFPDVIQFVPLAPAQSYQAVAAGTADLMQVWPDPTQSVQKVRDALGAQYPEQLHRDAVGFTKLLFTNTQRLPFSDVRARQALALAINRSVLATDFNVPTVTCELVPPNYPGYQSRCPFTSSLDAVGNLARARALVNESGTRDVPIRVFLPQNRNAAAEYLAGVLKSLGYRHVTWQVAKPDQNYEGVTAHDRTISVGVNGWLADYPSASSYYLPLFQCGAGFQGWYCNHALDAKVGAALSTQFSDPSKAQSLWQDIYRTIADQAVVIPFATDSVDYFVSRRANGNFQSGWFNGPLLDQMWVQ